MSKCILKSKKRALWALFFFLTSCCGSSGAIWQAENAIGQPGYCNSARLYLCPANNLSGLELEFVNMRDGLRLYINVYGLAIPPDSNDSSNSRVFISFRDHSYTFSAARHLGGQRLLIPENVQEEIVDYLQEGQPIFLRVGRYEADINPNQFIRLFKCMAQSL